MVWDICFIQVLHPKHPQHPLHLFDHPQESELGWCDVCLHDIEPVLGYWCSICDFDFGVKCGRISKDMILEENRQIEHPSHPDHLLTLMRKPLFPFRCDGCGVEGVDNSTCMQHMWGVDSQELCIVAPRSPLKSPLQPPSPFSCLLFSSWTSQTCIRL